jgi:hypothetical protein
MSEADFREPQEDDAEDRAGVFLRLQAGVGPELVGGSPETRFKRGGVGVLRGRCDPFHNVLIYAALSHSNIILQI